MCCAHQLRPPMRRQRVEIDAIEAAHVHRGGLLTLRINALRIGLNAAGRAEFVVDEVLVELEFGRRVLALDQRELIPRRERQDRARPPATRAIAGDGAGKVYVHLERDSAALAGAGVFLRGHGFLKSSLIGGKARRMRGKLFSACRTSCQPTPLLGPARLERRQTRVQQPPWAARHKWRGSRASRRLLSPRAWT